MRKKINSPALQKLVDDFYTTKGSKWNITALREEFGTNVHNEVCFIMSEAEIYYKDELIGRDKKLMKTLEPKSKPFVNLSQKEFHARHPRVDPSKTEYFLKHMWDINKECLNLDEEEFLIFVRKNFYLPLPERQQQIMINTIKIKWSENQHNKK